MLQETRIPILLHIFDNASTDDTREYVLASATTDSRIRYTRNPTNIGAIRNFIGALESIETEYFVPLADDDWLLPDFLFDAYREITMRKDLGAVIFVTSLESEDGEVLGTYPAHIDKLTFGFLTPEAHVRDWMRYGHYAWSSILWRKEALESIGRPYFHVGLPSDVDIQLQIFCRYPVCLINRAGAVLFLHPNQGSRAIELGDLQSWASLFKRLDRSVRDHRLFSPSEYVELRKIMRDRYLGLWRQWPEFSSQDSQLLSVACSAGFRLGDWELAFELLDKFVALQAVAGREASIPNFMLPETGATSGSDATHYLSQVSGFLPSIVAWFKLSSERLTELEAQSKADQSDRQALECRIADMTIQLAESAGRTEALDGSLQKWRSRAEKSLNGRLHRWWRRIRGKA